MKDFANFFVQAYSMLRFPNKFLDRAQLHSPNSTQFHLALSRIALIQQELKIGSQIHRVGHMFFLNKCFILTFISVHFKWTFRSLRSFPFSENERLFSTLIFIL